MSRQMRKSGAKAMSLVMKSVGLSAGAAMLFGSGGVMALSAPSAVNANAALKAGSQTLQLAQVDNDNDVVVDTDTETGYPDTVGGTNNGDARFTCDYVNGQHTVMYRPETQPGQSYPWATPSAMGGGWTPQARCNAISQRLEEYRPDGLLELRTGRQNGYNTVCVTTQAVPSCRIVFTVPRGQDAIATRDSVFQNLTVADSGQTTQGVYTYRNGSGLGSLGGLLGLPSGSRTNARRSGNIQLRPFLDRKDGGTATGLRRSVRTTTPARRSNPTRLNPGSFR